MSGPFGSSQWMYASGGFYNGVATQSLRFDDGSSAYLSRTPASAGNRKTWTWSGWVKRSNLGATHTLFDSRPTGEFAFGFLSGDTFYVASSSNFRITNQVFRDVSSWYHFVVVLDTTQATGSNRIKVYVNGNQITSFGTSADPSQNAEFGVNFTQLHSLGRYTSGGYFDGYMAEVNLIDGQALDPTSFGETKNGVWIAKEYTGSYGTNGFRLQFNQTGTGTASSSTIGADTSGNDNHFSSSGIVASDCDMPDSPENNFSTLNPLQIGQSNWTLSEGNLKGVSSTSVSGGGGVLSTMGVSSGKWYWECLLQNLNSDSSEIGIANTNSIRTDVTLGRTSDSYAYLNNGNKFSNNSSSSYGATYTTGDIIGVALDLDGGTLTFYKNNASQGTAFSSLPSGYYVMGVSEGSTGNQQTQILNFGQDSTFAGNETAGGNADANGIGDFYYSPPSGYLALCTANLPEPTISPNADTQADDYFNTATYSGNSSTQNITSVGFQPDWVWIKSRSNASNNYVTDVVRGTSKGLQTNISNAEVTNTNVITSFNSDGFSLGDDATANVANITGRTYVSWNWKAGGTAVSNTDGSITSSVSANTDAGFSIVSFTGNKTRGATIGHGLGVKPDMIIMKNRDLGVSWVVWFPNLQANNQLLELNSTGAVLTNTGDPNAWWNNTSPTSSVITLGDYDGINDDLSMIAYCFAEIEGYSKFGSYTGNGSSDGTFVYTGFRPAWIMFKRTDSTNHWLMLDNKRNVGNLVHKFLLANASDAEDTSNDQDTDFTSNGFKVRNSNARNNASGGSYIYMAFAENPFKYANAR